MSSINLNISPSPDELTVDDAVLEYTNINDGFVHTIQDIALKTSETKKLIEELDTQVGPFKRYDFSSGKNNNRYKFFSDKARIYVGGNSLNSFISAYGISEDIVQTIWSTYKKYIKEDNNIDVYINSYFMSNGILDDTRKRMKTDDMKFLSQKYYPYIDTEMMFNQFFTGSENIFLIVGEPGLGKSKLGTLAIQHAFTNPDKLPYDKKADNPGLEEQYINIVYVKSIDVLVNDKFWGQLQTEQVDIVIIDDLDYMLTRRNAEVQTIEDTNKNTFINQFLSFTDGVEKNHTKFIITTNQPFDEIDSALLRKGRLFDIIELRRLHYDEGLEIWKENSLNEDEFKKIFTSDEILPANLGSEISKRLNKRIKKATESYLKEPGISKVQKAGRTKKISL